VRYAISIDERLCRGDVKVFVAMAIFQPRRRQKRTESGLSERQFEVNSFTIIAARNRSGSRRKIAD